MRGNLLKKTGAILLAVVMLVSIAGCSSPKQEAVNNTDTTGETAGEAADSNGEWTGDISRIVVTYLTGTSSLPADFQLVQDTVNEMTIPAIGVEVEFKPITVFEAMSQYSMWIGAGEEIDLMQIAFTDLNSYITQGMIEPIDELLDTNAPYLRALEAEGLPIFDTTKLDEIYGVNALGVPTGNAGGFMFRAEDLEAAGLDFTDGDAVTLEQLDEIFARIKETKPEVYPCGVTGQLPAAGYVIPNDALGATAASGVLVGSESETVVNLYETDEYYEYLEYLRSWYEKGYILKDAATTELSYEEYMTSGTISGYFGEGYKGLAVMMGQRTGVECVSLMLNEPYLKSITSSGSAFWTIPVTCSEPEAAIRFVNMLYENQDLSNLIQYGIEDKHYTITDAENGVITIPQDSAYINGLGLWGDIGKMHAIGWRDTEVDNAWAETAIANTTKGYGFCYDSSAMTNQIIAVQGVISEYTPALETGSAELESTYNEFIDKMKANGIEDIIADKQAQFDEWLANQ